MQRIRSICARRNGAAKKRNAKDREALDKDVDALIASRRRFMQSIQRAKHIVAALSRRRQLPPPIDPALKHALELGEHSIVLRYLGENPDDSQVVQAFANSFKHLRKHFQAVRTQKMQSRIREEFALRHAEATANGARVSKKQVRRDVANARGVSLSAVEKATKGL